MSFSTYQPLAVYPANGVQTDFNAPDWFYDEADCKAVIIVGGAEDPQVRGVDFTVIVTQREQQPPYRKQGLLRFVVPPANGLAVVTFIQPALVQDQPFQSRTVSPKEHERVHDRHVQSLAILMEFFNRGYRSPLNTPAALRYIAAGREGYVPTWDSSGNLVEGPTVGQVATVAQFIGNVNAVAAIQAEVVAVSNLDTEIVGLYAIRSDIAALGPAASGIVALAPLDDELIALAPFATQIGQLAPYSVQVGQVAAIRVDVETVADNIADIEAVVANMAAINAAPGAAAAAATSETNAAASEQRAYEWANNPENDPVDGGEFSAYHWAKKAEASAGFDPANYRFSIKNMGEYYFADTGEAGVAIPPSAVVAGNTWVELTAGLTGVGQFNNGKLSGESVSGSAPNVTATANVAVAGPMNGVNIVLLNSERRFLRPGSPGTKEANQNLSHAHTGVAASAGAHTHGLPKGSVTTAGARVSGASDNNGTTQSDSAGAHTHTLTIDANGGTEARPNNIGIRIFRKVG